VQNVFSRERTKRIESDGEGYLTGFLVSARVFPDSNMELDSSPKKV
jgi:hypothetical protein